MASAPLRVMQSFRAPRASSNPYIHMLDASLAATPGMEHIRFSWRRALLGRVDVLHFHWPEVALGGRTPLRRFVRRSRFQLLLWSLRARRVRIVRTVHNLELPSGIPAWERRMLRAVVDRAAVRIVLNGASPAAGAHLIPHGDYVEWFEGTPRSERVPGRLVFLGLIRRYKGVEQLIGAFGALRAERDDVSLEVAGRPTSDGIAEQLIALADGVPDVALRFAYLSEEDYAARMSSAELAVLPYTHMHNSGSALAALSLGTPILVPDNEVNRALAHEVGPAWVHLFTEPLDATALQRALDGARSLPYGSAPDLSDRRWTRTGGLHLAAYRAAVRA